MVATLTIIVPTYNRADSLELLLNTLGDEIGPLAGRVVVIVGDNASVDRTSDVTEAFRKQSSFATIVRHAENVGPEENFCRCLERVTSRYFWIIGDDDLPKRGVLAKILALLDQMAPGLVYMQSEWVNPILSSTAGEAIHDLRFEVLDPVMFARRVHIWTTFISGTIVDRSLFETVLPDHAIRRFVGTHLVQLGWVLPLLAKAPQCVFVEDRCVLATRDNTGGYSVMTVFGANFARIVHEIFGAESTMGRTLVQGALLHYLPAITWRARPTSFSRRSDESVWPSLRRELGQYSLFWLLLVPLWRLPRPLALPLYLSWSVFGRMHKIVQRVHGKLKYGHR